MKNKRFILHIEKYTYRGQNTTNKPQNQNESEGDNIMTQTMPGTEIDAETDDIARMAIHTIDNGLDDVLGIRPGRTVGRILTAIAPANAIHNLTNLDKPGEVIEKLMNHIESDIESTRFASTSTEQTVVEDTIKHPTPPARKMNSGIGKPVKSEPPVTEAAGTR